MKKKLVLFLLTLAAVALLLAGCKQTDPSSAPEAVSAPSQAAAPEVTPEPTPEPTPTPPPEASSTWMDEFEDIWDVNPIRVRLESDLDMAASFSAIQDAYSSAMGYWQRLIQIAYEDCLTVLAAAEQEQLKAEQAQWEQEIVEKADAIYADYPDDAEGTLSATEALLALYEGRARTLCEIKYGADGAMPSFEEAMEAPEAAG